MCLVQEARRQGAKPQAIEDNEPVSKVQRPLGKGASQDVAIEVRTRQRQYEWAIRVPLSP